MRHSAVVVTVLALALLASVYYLAQHTSIQEPPDPARKNEVAPVQTPSIAEELVLAADIAGVRGEQVVTELRAMSQTYRDSTFLIAIRGAGFYCDEVVSADESAEGVWLASCADKRGYTLGVLADEQFDVRPVAHYFDGLVPQLLQNDQFRLDRDPSLELREPQQFR
jgi:hypothetical protein